MWWSCDYVHEPQTYVKELEMMSEYQTRDLEKEIETKESTKKRYIGEVEMGCTTAECTSNKNNKLNNNEQIFNDDTEVITIRNG